MLAFVLLALDAAYLTVPDSLDRTALGSARRSSTAEPGLRPCPPAPAGPLPAARQAASGNPRGDPLYERITAPARRARQRGDAARLPGAGRCELLAADFALAPYELAALVGELPPTSPGGVERTGTALQGRRRANRWQGDDPLARIPPPVYFAGLCGVAVPAQGGVISCPLPGHEDAHPSCVVAADPGRGWRCFSHPGGPVGGRVYDLASALAGGPVGPALRGAGFLAAKRAAEQRLTVSPSVGEAPR